MCFSGSKNFFVKIPIVCYNGKEKHPGKDARGLPKGEMRMDTVVILDNDNKWILNYKRMLSNFPEEAEFRFFQQPEAAMEYLSSNQAAVFACEMDMPLMSGDEALSMVEMMSPDTVGIAIMQGREAAKALDIFNRHQIHKLIVKPFSFPEEIQGPIRSALAHYREQIESGRHYREMIQEFAAVNRKQDQILAGMEEKKQRYDGIFDVAAGIIRGNIHSEAARLTPEENKRITGFCVDLLHEFMHYYLFEERNSVFQINFLLNLFHFPGKSRSFKILNETGKDIPQATMQKLSYGIFLGGYYCRQALAKYRASVKISIEGPYYALQMDCEHPTDGDVFLFGEEARFRLRRFLEEIAGKMSDHMELEVKDAGFSAKLHYRQET